MITRKQHKMIQAALLSTAVLVARQEPVQAINCCVAGESECEALCAGNGGVLEGALVSMSATVLT